MLPRLRRRVARPPSFYLRLLLLHHLVFVFLPSSTRGMHNNNITSYNNLLTRDKDGNVVGDVTSPLTRTVLGFVQDCAGVPPRQQGTLCGAKGSYLAGHYLWVAATDVDTVTAVDLYRPSMPTVAGSVRDAKRLRQVVATWMHRSNEFIVALSPGRRPHADGHVTLIDVRQYLWSQDPSYRFLVSPKVHSWITDCAVSDDPTFPRKLGRLCGARAMHVVDDLVYVVAELTHTISVLRLPERLSPDLSLIHI